MRSFSRAIDRFCLTHRRFGIQRLMLYIIIGNVAVYLLALLDRSHTIVSLLSFSPSAILHGQIWRLVTWVFSSSAANASSGGLMGSLLFTALLLYFYYFIGQTLEREWGTAKFTFYYLVGLGLNILYGFIYWLVSGMSVYPPLDSGYLNLSMFFAFAVMFPEQRVLLFFIIPVKIKWLALLDAAYFVLQMILALFAGQFAYAFLPLIAFLNFFLFCGSELRGIVAPYKVNMSKQTIDFKKAAKKYKQNESTRPYRHKCAVCGKTDAEFPNLEFRYCSRCNGYHCFCIDHINNHVHFQ